MSLIENDKLILSVNETIDAQELINLITNYIKETEQREPQPAWSGPSRIVIKISESKKHGESGLYIYRHHW